MWKVGGIKIERTEARDIFFPAGHGNWRKSEIFGKTLPTRKFSKGNFFGASTKEILSHPDSKNIVGRASVLKLW